MLIRGRQAGQGKAGAGAGAAGAGKERAAAPKHTHTRTRTPFPAAPAATHLRIVQPRRVLLHEVNLILRAREEGCVVGWVGGRVGGGRQSRAGGLRHYSHAACHGSGKRGFCTRRRPFGPPSESHAGYWCHHRVVPPARARPPTAPRPRTCRMIMFLSCIISTAARCSLVCGCGQGSLPAMSNSAASMTAAPLSIVAMRMSWPGQSVCAAVARAGRAAVAGGEEAAAAAAAAATGRALAASSAPPHQQRRRGARGAWCGPCRHPGGSCRGACCPCSRRRRRARRTSASCSRSSSWRSQA